MWRSMFRKVETQIGQLARMCDAPSPNAASGPRN